MQSDDLVPCWGKAFRQKRIGMRINRRNRHPWGPFVLWAVLLVFQGLRLTCQAELRLSGDFDHGSLASFAVDGDRVELVGRDNYFGGDQWRWLYFRADDVANQKPTFRIPANFAGGANRLANHKMVYSYDETNWHFFDDNRVTPANQFEFSNVAPFTQDRVFVAYAIPYPYELSVRHTQEVLSTEWASPTPSADADGVLGQSPGGVDDLGRTVAPKDLFGYRITNPNTDDPNRAKHKVVLASGLHANETLGTHTFEGLVNWLVSDDPRAGSLRNVAEFYAYPVLNPDGRFAGQNRATVENPARDPNHVWSPSLWSTHKDIRVSGEAMIADARSTPGNTDVFIDFHSTIPAWPDDDFGYLEFEQGDHQSDFWLELKRLQPNIRDVDSTSTTWTTANFGEAFLNAEVDITFETQFGFDRPLAYYHDLGKNFGLAFHNIWAPTFICDFDQSGSCGLDDIDALIGAIASQQHPASFDVNGDGQVTLSDRDEWLVVAANVAGHSNAFLLGDTNLDTVVNAVDLNLVGRNWQAHAPFWSSGDFDADGQIDAQDLNELAKNWQASVAVATLAVPEPHGAVWRLWLGLILFAMRRFQ